MNVIHSTFVGKGNPELQDRVSIVSLENRMVLILADGSGGLSGGAEAAELFLRLGTEVAPKLNRAEDCFRFVYEADQHIYKASDCGETTGVIVVVSSIAIFGANVGDSAVWLFTPGDKHELTRVRKPYLGTGVAAPHQFSRERCEGTLVAASDGLWKYTSIEAIEKKIRAGNPGQFASELAELVRLRSGTFPDDIAVGTARLLP